MNDWFIPRQFLLRIIIDDFQAHLGQLLLLGSTISFEKGHNFMYFDFMDIKIHLKHESNMNPVENSHRKF